MFFKNVLKSILKWIGGFAIIATVLTAVSGTYFAFQYRDAYLSSQDFLTDAMDQLVVSAEEINGYKDVLSKGRVDPDSELIFTNPEKTVLSFPLANSKYLFITSPYGKRNNPFSYTGGRAVGSHWATDWAAGWKAQVFPVGIATVTDHFPPPNGNWVGTWHGDDVLGGKIEITLDTGEVIVYGHLSETYVMMGDRITDLTKPIGRIGNTGISTGQHLHLEIWEDGIAQDPLEYFNLRIETVPGYSARGKVTVLDGSFFVLPPTIK